MFFGKKRIKRFAKAEEGAAIIIAAFSLVAFLSIVSFVTDMGLKYHQKSQLQSAMDSAALAAVRYMPDEVKAKAVALEYVEKNGFSSENVVVEFPSNEIVRVSDSMEGKTIFASLFKVDSIQIKANAAAKYVDKKMSIGFDYLMFHGDKTTFNLGGHYNIGGSIFGNGDVYANGGSGSTISGAVASAQKADANIYSVSVSRFESNLPHCPMPDFDETIMAVAPEADESMFVKSYDHISSSSLYMFKYPAGSTISSLVSINGSTYCSGNLSTSGTELLTIYGDLYVEGDFNPQCPVYVTGDVYCGGNLNTAWGKDLKVGGDLYVKGNSSLQGDTVVYGDYFYTGGNLTRGSTYTLKCDCETYVGGELTLRGNSTFNGPIYSMGKFTKGGSVSLNVNGNIYAYNKLSFSNGGTIVNGDIFVYGDGASSTGTVADVSGPFTLIGDFYNEKGDLRLTGQGGYYIRGVLYSKGTLTTEQGANGITLDGCIIADGDIKIGGTTHTYNESGSTLSIYSRKGDISLYSAAGGFDLWGIIYAPKGNVALSSGDFDIYGSIIANTISCYPGGLNMGYNDRELPYSKKVKTAVLIE